MNKFCFIFICTKFVDERRDKFAPPELIFISMASTFNSHLINYKTVSKLIMGAICGKGDQREKVYE